MKANELMIGDWVLYNETSQQILEISGIDDEVYLETDELVHQSEIQPIPLTPEILEKNGFKNGKLNVSPQYYLEDNGVFIGVTLKDIPDKHKGIDIAKGRLFFQLDVSRMEEPLYIHQLQHALKLCGINKDILL